ncbi:MAG: TetR/AcrR family transcriptional regulator [Acidobacteria bacterium]|nr:TetR/AcrR family transcriptional regulator [Acidobacteriota bacterium]
MSPAAQPAHRRRISADARRRQILHVAAGLFARHGFDGATTKQIATRAGVTEALVFRHFPRKVDLYWSVIEFQCQLKRSDVLYEKLGANGNDEAVLAAIAEDVLRRNMEDQKLLRLLLYTGLEQHQLSRRFFRTHIAERYEVLAAYIRRRTREGGFHRTNPLLAARNFFGMVIYHLLTQEIFGGKYEQKFNIREVSHTLAATWLDGMRARRSNGLHTNHRKGRT